MKKMGAIILGVFSILIIICLILGGTLLSHRNTAVSLEERIESQYIANQSNYDSMWKTLKEMTQVTELQANQFKDLYYGLIQGRYQDENLLFKSIQEQNPNLDTNVYKEIQREISANRKTFDNNQKQIADIIREYNTYIKKHFIMASITNRQPKNAKDYIVTSDRTEKAFESGKDYEIKLKED